MQLYQQQEKYKNDVNDNNDSDDNPMNQNKMDANREYGEPQEWNSKNQIGNYNNYLNENIISVDNMNNCYINENTGEPIQYDPSELQPFSNEKLRNVDSSNQNDNIVDYDEQELMERYEN